MNWDVVVRHDTTMWNEGFEHAREPYAVITVSSQTDADALAAWVNTTYGLRQLPWDDIDKAFTAKTHPSSDQLREPMSFTEAKSVVAARISEWLGL